MSEQEFALTFERQEQQSGEPRRPVHIPGLRAWLTRANVKARKQWATKRQEWVDDGCPPVTVTVRTYIPRARIESTDGNTLSFTAHPTEPAAATEETR